MEPINSFTNEYRFLSNFYPANVFYDGEIYPSVEHAYQAAKTLDKEDRKRIGELRSAGAAKKAGYKVKLRQDWESIKLDVMFMCLKSKFIDNPGLKKMLLDTGLAHLEEGNNWGDTYWGTVNGKGENHLGRLLMRVRADLVCGV